MSEVSLVFPSSGLGTETPRQYFRRFLGQHAPAVRDLAWYFDQALPQFAENPEVRLAVEELVDQLGRAMGFTVVRDEAAGYGAWESPVGSHLLVWVLDSQSALRHIGQSTRVRDALLATPALPSGSQATCLFVIGGPVNQKVLADTVTFRRSSDHIRLLTVDGARVLAELVERGEVSHDAALTLLRPPGVFADPLVAMLQRPAAE